MKGRRNPGETAPARPGPEAGRPGRCGEGAAPALRRTRGWLREAGLTFIELVAAVAIVLVVAAAVIPVGVNAVRRTKELQLRRALTTMRGAIDEYHRYAQIGSIQPWDPDWEFYPKDLEMLIEGAEITSPQNPVPKTVRFLREVPTDPMSGEAVWGMRSYQDEPDSEGWGEENLYDVYSLSPGAALDGTEYSTW